MSTDNLPFDDAMKRALDDAPVSPMSADFADRVVAATQGRARPLPPTRPAPVRRWRTGRRLVIGAVAAGALATTAAATGLLEEFGINLPSPQEVWTRVTGQESLAPVAPAPPPRLAPEPEIETPVVIEGPIDTPEELEEAFRRVDEARANRREGRRERVDTRIDNAIERRREQGLQAPTPEQEERLRGRIDRMRERADERREDRAAVRRDELRETLEQEGEVTREDVIDTVPPDSPLGRRLQRLRQLQPDERREALRQWRERRQDRLDQKVEAPPAENLQAEPDFPEPPPER